LLYLGIVDDFYKWTIEFGILYLPNASGQISLPSIRQAVFALAPFGIFVFGGGLLPWAFVGALGTYPRWELFHFQPALPFLSIAISSFMFSSKKRMFKIIVIAIFALHFFVGIERMLGSDTRFYEPQVRSIVNEIKRQNAKEIYIANYWDNVYTLTNTLPVTSPLIPYIPWYLEYSNNKHEPYKEVIISSLKLKMPEIIVIGERDNVFPELYIFVDKFYSCKIINKVELCEKN
jgi:hypothetical protein